MHTGLDGWSGGIEEGLTSSWHHVRGYHDGLDHSGRKWLR